MRTGQKVFNPGRTQVVNALALGMSCKLILLHQGLPTEAVYGIVGETLDADYVCQMGVTLVPLLQTMAKLEGAEHGYEKAGLVRWTNQYLTGAAVEIKNRLDAERKSRSDAKKEEQAIMHGNNPGYPDRRNALTVITGESLAVAKREATAVAFKQMYPKTKTHQSHAGHDGTAHAAGRKAGKRVGLNI